MKQFDVTVRTWVVRENSLGKPYVELGAERRRISARGIDTPAKAEAEARKDKRVAQVLGVRYVPRAWDVTLRMRTETEPLVEGGKPQATLDEQTQRFEHAGFDTIESVRKHFEGIAKRQQDLDPSDELRVTIDGVVGVVEHVPPPLDLGDAGRVSFDPLPKDAAERVARDAAAEFAARSMLPSLVELTPKN